MTSTVKTSSGVASAERPQDRNDHLVERLIDRLPNRIQKPTRWLRQPSSRWVRLPAGVLLIIGGLLSILPLFGLWMLPLGLFLLAEDMPPLRRTRNRILERIERHRPHWFVTDEATPSSESLPPAPPAGSSSDTRS